MYLKLEHVILIKVLLLNFGIFSIKPFHNKHRNVTCKNLI